MTRKKKYKSFVQILYMTKNLSAKDLHKKVKGKLTYETLRKWKRGDTLYPRYDSMETVLNALGHEFVIRPKNRNNND